MRRLLLLALVISLLAASAVAQADAFMRVAIEGKGSFTIQLFTEKAPKTTAHIIKLVRSGFYDRQRFHIAIHSPRPYRIQVGDPASKDQDLDRVGSGGSGESVPYENSGLSNEVGAVGLSTIPGDKNSGDSQFYVLLGNAGFLDGNYTVFGKVVEGMDVVNKIEKGDRIQRATISDK